MSKYEVRNIPEINNVISKDSSFMYLHATHCILSGTCPMVARMMKIREQSKLPVVQMH